jgi:hypothetical protein
LLSLVSRENSVRLCIYLTCAPSTEYRDAPDEQKASYFHRIFLSGRKIWFHSILTHISYNQPSALFSNLFKNYIYFIVVMLGGGTWDYLQKFLQYIKYIIFEFISSAALFYSPFPDSQNSLNRCHFCISHVCIHYLDHLPLRSPHPCLQAKPV